MIDKDLVTRKLTQMTGYLNELREISNGTKEKFVSSGVHYEAERLVELIVSNAIDINFHIIKERQLSAPKQYRESFLELGKNGILNTEFSQNIANSVGLRNILVHHYDEIDLDIFYDGLKGGIKDYQQYIKEINQFIEK